MHTTPRSSFPSPINAGQAVSILQRLVGLKVNPRNIIVSSSTPLQVGPTHGRRRLWQDPYLSPHLTPADVYHRSTCPSA